MFYSKSLMYCLTVWFGILIVYVSRVVKPHVYCSLLILCYQNRYKLRYSYKTFKQKYVGFKRLSSTSKIFTWQQTGDLRFWVSLSFHQPHWWLSILKRSTISTNGDCVNFYTAYYLNNSCLSFFETVYYLDNRWLLILRNLNIAQKFIFCNNYIDCLNKRLYWEVGKMMYRMK